METLLIEQAGTGALAPLLHVPETLARYVLDTATPVGLIGEGFTALFQRMAGAGFAVWLSRYTMQTTTVLKATGNAPALELRIALRGQINGTWDTVLSPELPPLHYQLHFVPHVATRALFEAHSDYETFDIHFDLAFLEGLGIDYATFERFIGQVLNNQPAALSLTARRCPPLMLEAVQAILRNSYSPTGKTRLLQNNVENILLAALEDTHRVDMILPALSAAQVTALHEVKRLIEENIPYYPR